MGSFYVLTVKEIINNELAKKGLDWDSFKGLLYNQKDYVREEGQRILQEIAQMMWNRVEEAGAVSEDMLDAEFGEEDLDMEVVDNVLKNMSMEVDFNVV